MKKIKFILLFIFVFGFISNSFANLNSETTTTIPVQNQKKQTKVEQITSWYMDNMNYGTITLLMTIESSFIPFPSEVVVPPAAYKASKEGSDLNIFLVIVFATIGAIIGALINYFLALWLGRPIVHKFADSKFGKLCLLSSEKVTKAENYFVKHGRSSTFIGRLVPGIRQLISIPAGLAKMPLLPFVLFTTLGAGVWNIILALLGYLAHGQADLINEYSSELSYILLGLGVLFVAYLVYSNFIKKKKASSQK
ncbi:MAG TPA: DedA family protein [Bacteroidales bacterium]|nr:DedA family protein [Bacteroidales bacterium]